MKKKQVTTSIEIVSTDKEIRSSKTTSEDINMINNSLIENVRFEFAKREILSYKGRNEKNSVLNTMDTLIAQQQQKAGKIFESEQQLIDNILTVKKFETLSSPQVSFIESSFINTEDQVHIRH